MKWIIENIKARIHAVPYDIYKEEITDVKGDEWYYNGVLYYGQRWGVFFRSFQNKWFKDSHNNPINKTTHP